jgi:prepilin-type N-terminal cleavage/methylation domain-containing protein
MKNNDRLTTRAGFTLIELLVTMAVSLIVLFAVLQLFENSQKSYVVQEEVAETQQNVRVAKMFLERDIRMAGAGITNSTEPGATSFSYGGVVLDSLGFENNVDGSAGEAASIANIVAGTDLLVVRYKNFESTSCGTDGVNPSCDSLPQLTLDAEMPASSAEVEVDEDLIAGVGWDATCYCNGETYDTSGSSVVPAIITEPDCTRSQIIFINAVQANSDKFQNRPVTVGEVSYVNKLANSYSSGSTINFFPADGVYTALYYIEDQSGVPCLMRDLGSGGQVIAEYIEDLQISFGLDTTGDGAVDTTVNSADLSGASTDDVRTVTLSLVGRSPHAHRNFSGQRPALEDHAAGAADGFRRRQLSVTIKVRNLGL